MTDGEQMPIHDAALDLEFGDRVVEYRTGKLLGKLDHNIRKAGITESWNEYLDVMNTVDSSRAELLPNGRTRLILDFADNQACKTFNILSQKLFAGTHGPTGLLFHSNAEQLQLTNFGFEDLATLGRVSSALFNEEYGDALAQNIRILRQHTLQDIQSRGLEEYLPAVLRERIAQQVTVMGESSADTLLSSGYGISKIGNAIREALASSEILPMQRDSASRPAIEEGLDFHYRSLSASGTRAVSGTTTRQAVKGQATTDLSTATESFKKRDVSGIGKIMYDIVTGGVIADAASSATRTALITLEGTVAALGGFIEDRGTKRVQEGRIPPPSPPVSWGRNRTR